MFFREIVLKSTISPIILEHFDNSKRYPFFSKIDLCLFFFSFFLPQKIVVSQNELEARPKIEEESLLRIISFYRFFPVSEICHSPEVSFFFFLSFLSSLLTPSFRNSYSNSKPFYVP